MESEFKGASVLVTGGARGIGRAIALAFAGRGASVAIIYAKNDGAAALTVEEIARRGGAGLAVRCDVRDPGAVDAAVAQAEARHGGIRILVNSAGCVRDSLMTSMQDEDWRAVIDTNLSGAFHCMRAVAEGMVLRRSGRIINVSSLAGERGGRGQANYAASKGGLNALTRAAALELAPRGVTVNAVAPGMVVTEMTESVRGLAGEKLKRSIPARRYAVPEDIAGVVLFLASDAASYITGQVIGVDGGLGASIQY